MASEVSDWSKHPAHIHTAAVCAVGYSLIASLVSRQHHYFRKLLAFLKAMRLQVMYINVIYLSHFHGPQSVKIATFI